MLRGRVQGRLAPLSDSQMLRLAEVADRHAHPHDDPTGYRWIAAVIEGVPRSADRLGVVFAADRKWRAERAELARAREQAWQQQKTVDRSAAPQALGEILRRLQPPD